MGQMLVQGGQVAENLARAEDLILEAGRRDCEVVVLPECLDLGWTDPSARELATGTPGVTRDRVANAACRAGVTMVAGLTEKSGAKIFNTAVCFDQAGVLLSTHREVNTLDIAQDLYTAGRSGARCRG